MNRDVTNSLLAAIVIGGGCAKDETSIDPRVTFHRRRADTAADYDAGVAIKWSAAASLTLWFAIILFGRLIVAFQGSSDF